MSSAYSSISDATAAPQLRVPYVIAWSGEAVPHPLVFTIHNYVEGPRLTYIDPRPSDWVDGILRARVGEDRSGDPQWRMLNTRRQWLCITLGLCQVCGESAMDMATNRLWWVITETAFRATGADGGLTNAPPTCRSCLPESLAHCPQLRKSSAVYTVSCAEPAGVLADVLKVGRAGVAERVAHNEFVGFDELARHPYILATQLVVRLYDMRPESAP